MSAPTHPLDPVPALPRGVRLHQDRVRGGLVLLAPERALMLDEVGAAVLGLVDGQRPLSAICAELASRYEAPLTEITADVQEFLSGLATERLLDWREGAG